MTEKNWSPPSSERAIDKAREGVRAALVKMLDAAPNGAGRVCVAGLLAEVAIEELKEAVTGADQEMSATIARVEQAIVATGKPFPIPKKPNMLGLLRRKVATLEQRMGNLYGETLTLYPQALSEMAQAAAVPKVEGV